jgi:hypothetical protein
MGVSKSPRLGVMQLCGTITSCVELRLGWGLNWSCSPRRDLSNGVSHTTCTQRNRVDSWLSVVITCGHNLCWRCPNGSCEPILDIYTSIAFQWYKDLLKVRGFSLCNRSLKFQKSIGTPTPKMEVHLGVWVFILTLSHTPGLLSWPALLQSLALVVSPRLGLRHPNLQEKGKLFFCIFFILLV